MLIWRDREREQLDALLTEARLGRSRALVLRGSAGIGKTLLLDHAVQQASGFQVLHYTAVESEAELPFAGLQAPVPKPRHAPLTVLSVLSQNAIESIV